MLLNTFGVWFTVSFVEAFYAIVKGLSTEELWLKRVFQSVSQIKS